MAPKTKATASKPKPRSSAASKPKSKPPPNDTKKPKDKKTKETATSSDPASPEEVTFKTFDKNLVLRIILAKLEASKTCDWYALSQKLHSSSSSAPAAAEEGTPAKGTKGKKVTKTKETSRAKKAAALSGADLHHLYHNHILPALKSGHALWVDDPDPGDSSFTITASEEGNDLDITKSPKTNNLPPPDGSDDRASGNWPGRPKRATGAARASTVADYAEALDGLESEGPPSTPSPAATKVKKRHSDECHSDDAESAQSRESEEGGKDASSEFEI